MVECLLGMHKGFVQVYFRSYSEMEAVQKRLGWADMCAWFSICLKELRKLKSRAGVSGHRWQHLEFLKRSSWYKKQQVLKGLGPEMLSSTAMGQEVSRRFEMKLGRASTLATALAEK